MREIYIRKEYSVAQIAYLAGIIDGEGSIYIGHFSYHPITNDPYFQTNIQITNTERGLVDWLQSTFGGWVNIRTRAQTPKNSRKTVYSWTATGDRITHICELIQPYTVIKKRQVEIMLKMRSTFENHCKGTGKRLNKNVLALRQSLMSEMRSLHNRTYSYKNHGSLPRVDMP